MTATYASHVSTKVTPQSQPIPGTTQVPNSAGGFTWTVDCWQRLGRFLILGSEGGSYYAGERELTIQNANCVLECAKQDLARTINTIVTISDEGRAPKNDPAIFALGLLIAQKGEIGKAALEVIPKVCRIGTHLFQLVETIDKTRGWGRSVRRGIANWYLSKRPDQLAYQITKYQQRNGWSHRDVLRSCHAHSSDPVLNSVLRYAVRGEATGEDMNYIQFAHAAKTANEANTVSLIKNQGIPRECVQTQHLNSPKVWEALLEDMPITAMIRNLGKMSSIGLVAPMSDAAKYVCQRLGDVELLKKGRVHPLSILVAQKIYAQGRGDKGSLAWNAVPQVVDALDAAFYTAFQAVEPTGKRWLLGLDVSGSMGTSIAGMPITCREAVGALALVTAKTEPNYLLTAFSSRGWQGNGRSQYAGYGNGIEEVDFSRLTRLDTALEKLSAIPMGGTDCSLPMLYALERKIPVDVFAVYTDSETWHGTVHPSQALKMYRDKMGIPAKLIVLGMVANNFTIADPNDGGMLDVVGFDTSVPQVMAEFARG